ncbi:poly(glycerol-phosphate) alpha-glucosyltransferase [Lactobacillus sp. CBA3605]|uniref:glycosyltransferase family 4 protein n=1 Tax=Lactobacillus sp. CBA3605 TaxID=2099788 RepID=UPI000CFDDBB6|nr:glycosyltransferase [Lactobacillus sp. CBA3605]AVK61073.1 poly(glycerol-phosphate) alpha-glucosyltransferase [Lactobacillus sp. CBA3605]
MYYFVNTSINPKKSGIEHAEMKRLALFNQHQVPAQLVTRFFALNLHQTLKNAGIAEKNQVNLFDFIQKSTTFKPVKLTIDDLHLAATLRVQPDGHHYQVYQQNQLLMRIHTFAPDYQQVNNVQFFDVNGKLVKTDWYDTRGFKGLEQFYTFDGQVASEQVFDPAGKVVYQTFHLPNRQNETQNSLYRFINYHGQDWSFTGEQAMTRFFLDELNRQNPKSVFIIDRTYELAYSALRMRTKAFKVMHLHSNHLNDPAHPKTATLNYNYAYALNNLPAWNGVIAATPQQTHDFTVRYGTQPPVYTIPVGIVSPTTLAAPKPKWASRIPGKVIFVARLSEEKQQRHVIEAFKKVHAALPEATLDFWGYANGDTGKQLRQLVAKLKLTAVVKFNDYTTNLAAVYDQAQLAMLTSRAEGFALALLEGQSHGLPQIAYDVKYGPRDIIRDGYDGQLVPVNDIEALGTAMIKLLQDPAKMQAFSRQAYVDAKRYSPDVVWQQWQPLMQAAQAFYQPNQEASK